MAPIRRAALAAVGILLARAAPARAQALPPIEDRAYALDLHTSAALGSVRIVGMGGTAVAAAEGSAGSLANPAAAAVRLTTSKGSWDWDLHLDALTPVFASDFDNNGIRDDGAGTSIGTGGVALMIRGWGVAVTGTTASTALRGDAGEPLVAVAHAGKLAVARELLGGAWTAGAALRLGQFRVDRDARPLFSIAGYGVEVGALWRAPRRDWRAGAALALPARGSDVTAAGCDPTDCEGYILPGGVEAPWQLAAGVAWRRAPTRWNQQVDADFRDERALLVAADLVVTGGVDDGHGLEAFGLRRLQRSGRHPVASLRFGAEYEAAPGRLRVRGGTYWEPGRVEGAAGRLHATFGLEVALVQLRVWRWVYRLRVAATGDVAARYGNAGISVGFWH